MSGQRLACAMSATLAILASGFVATTLAAQPSARFHGNAEEGGAMHERDCVACHVRRVGGDGSAMYTRADRRVTSPDKLEAQIARCNVELGTRYFPEEEAHIAAYLDLRYYKFGN